MAGDWPRWGAMWTIALAIYAVCKLATWSRAITHGARAAWSRQAGYLLAWPGMDAAAFLAGAPPPRPARREWMAASIKIAIGSALIVTSATRLHDAPAVRGWLGMAGVVLVLHFGLFAVASCAWRRAGVDAEALMHAPLCATSVADFWGRRWNTAFRSLTYRFVFAPLRRHVGATTALAMGFACSGLVHDLVISVPAGGGYGGPSAFFVIQGVALLAERSAMGRRAGLGRGGRGRGFTLLVLLLPLPLLFHPPFVDRIVLPCLDALGAL